MKRAAALLMAAAVAGCAGAPSSLSGDQRWSERNVIPADLPAFFDCLRERGLAVVSAHRAGPAPGYPENSLEAAARLHVRLPALYEIDIRRTSDGALVLMHDETLERTTVGAGAVAETPLAVIQSLTLEDPGGTAVDGARAATLGEALAWAANKAILKLDVKRATPFDAVVREVQAAGAQGRVVIITTNAEDAAAVHRIDPTLMISAGVATIGDLDALAAAGVDLNRILAFTGTRLPDAALNQALGARGVEVIFGTLGRAGQSWDDRFAATAGDAGYAAFAAAGVQVLATDRPEAAFKALDAADGPGFAVDQCLIEKG